MSSRYQLRSPRVSSFGWLRVFSALALPACLLIDPPDGVNPDAPVESGGSAGHAGTAVTSGTGGKGAAGSPSGGRASNASGSGGEAGDETGGTSGNPAGAAGKGSGGESGSGATTGGSRGNTGGGGGAGAGGSGGNGGASGSGGDGSGGTAGTGAAAGTGPTGTCGNGIREGGEQCDDYNVAPGDGCSSDCTEESGWACSTLECAPTHPSCAASPNIQCQGESCCATQRVGGGAFVQGLGTETSFTNRLSGYALDKFEVTVARFRAFVADYDDWLGNGNPRAGFGAHHNIEASGWNSDWPYYTTAAGLTAALNGCNESTHYRTFAATGNDTLPMNCVDWYTAFLFCVWDGGRLPTEGEWEFAAVYGGYQYLYAFGDDPVLTDARNPGANYAVYGCMGDGSDYGECSTGDLLPVGSKAAQAEGGFGHLDLNGSVQEWVLDFNSVYPTLEKTDYAFVFGGFQRVVRGGSFLQDASFQTSIVRDGESADEPNENIGFRCARTPAP